jgi:hypothetical protein
MHISIIIYWKKKTFHTAYSMKHCEAINFRFVNYHLLLWRQNVITKTGTKLRLSPCLKHWWQWIEIGTYSKAISRETLFSDLGLATAIVIHILWFSSVSSDAFGIVHWSRPWPIPFTFLSNSTFFLTLHYNRSWKINQEWFNQKSHSLHGVILTATI